MLSLHEGSDHSLGVETAEVTVGLASAHKDDGFACDVGHRNSSSHLKWRKGIHNHLKASLYPLGNRKLWRQQHLLRASAPP